ncbi:DUF6939 family protein [Hymenobacter psoromatis]|uniref:DUF6939 family protein n=1 Tax=Hymenobacter psoromatis TaxID=1484116 RepID=UPI001CBB1E39|nr:hypothetical protein [Hymenobacter psoromatis]
MIFVESKKKSLQTIQKSYPNAVIIDVTSRGEEPWIKVSPFYPHGDIPIPFSEGHYAVSVEGIWQGLKVFEKEGVDSSKFQIGNMKGIKRTFRKFGKPLGHRKGIHGSELLDYITARYKIYLKSYAWMLDNKAQETIQLLKAEAEKNDLVILDFDTNGDLDDPKKPLSHAALVKRYLEKKYPEIASLTFSKPVMAMPQEKQKKKPRVKEIITKTVKTKNTNPKVLKNKSSDDAQFDLFNKN